MSASVRGITTEAIDAARRHGLQPVYHETRYSLIVGWRPVAPGRELAHGAAEALEAAAPEGVVVGEDERRVLAEALSSAPAEPQEHPFEVVAVLFVGRSA